MQGYVKLYRRLLESEVFEEPNLLKTWLWLLLNANWDDRPTRRGIFIERGQLVTSYDKASRALGFSINTVRRHFKVLSELEQIDIASDTRFTVVTICNYRSYQDEALKSHTLTDIQTDRKTDRTSAYRIRREEDNKRNRPKVFIYGDSERDATIRSWVKYKRTGARYTDQQIEAFIKQVEGIGNKSLELKVNRAIANSWKGLGDLTPEQPVKEPKKVDKSEQTRALLHDAKTRLKRLEDAGSGETVSAEALKKEIREHESTLHKARR